MDLTDDDRAMAEDLIAPDARAVIAGLIASESSDINRDGIQAPDTVWDQINALFPVELFHAWVARHQAYGASGVDDDCGYDPDAGL